MLEPTTVWLVRAGSMKETAGRISLDADAVSFTPFGKDELGKDEPTVVIPRGAVRDVRRLRGTPVVRLIHVAGGDAATLLLYFAKPPPLPGSRQAPGPPLVPRRGMERAAAGMSLRAAAKAKRGIMEAWVEALRG